ncbi:hypothetical protein GW17_00009414 [Ensete ventricosum]|nr:hypothetical protein GW17_00009414 [Ensete ventricosum]
MTGTLEYDVLHLGYLGFALVFFRMRLEILKRKNKIFKFLRIYNFTVIVLSLAYQSPYLGIFSSGKCEQIDYIYEVIGFYKYDYGFRITSRSALVEIIIFLLVSVQSYIFCSGEFEYVARYLEAEQIGAMVREQEKRAAWKTAQLQHIRKSEEQKRHRNMQVEKIKSEMLNLQVQLDSINSIQPLNNSTMQPEGLRHRRSSSINAEKVSQVPDNEFTSPTKQDEDVSNEAYHSFDFTLPEIYMNMTPPLISDIQHSPTSAKSGSSLSEDMKHNPDSICEISELGDADDAAHWNANRREKQRGKNKDNPLVSAVQLIGDGVSQVQSLGNQAVTNIAAAIAVAKREESVTWLLILPACLVCTVNLGLHHGFQFRNTHPWPNCTVNLGLHHGFQFCMDVLHPSLAELKEEEVVEGGTKEEDETVEEEEEESGGQKRRQWRKRKEEKWEGRRGSGGGG